MANDSLDLVEETRQKFQTRLDELRPQHEEFLKLEGIVAGFDTLANGSAPKRSTAGRKRGTSATADRAARGERPQQFINLVKANPGITVTEAADQMEGMNPNYLYRLAKEMTDGGKLRKEGKGYHFVAEASE